MKVIQLRATNAVGKTTIVRQFIKKYNLLENEETINKQKVFITANNDKSIIILGKYNDKWGGCDNFKNKVEVFETIIYLIKKYKPQYIIFEGMLYGKTFKFAYNLNNYLKKFNYEYLGITLSCDFEFSLKRLQTRNNNKEVNVEAFYNTWKAVIISHKKLLASKVKMKLIDVTNIKLEDMVKILENEVQLDKA